MLRPQERRVRCKRTRLSSAPDNVKYRLIPLRPGRGLIQVFARYRGRGRNVVCVSVSKMFPTGIEFLYCMIVLTIRSEYPYRAVAVEDHILFTKNGEALLAPLSHAAIARLKVVPRMQDNPYIICGRKAGQPLVNLNDAWNRIRAAAGLNDLRIHDLRRTVGSWLVRDGASLHLVGSVLNHKDQKTTAGYAYFQTRERHKALDKHGRNVIDRGGPDI